MLRLLVLKHLRNRSYQGLEREVRANLVHHDFTRAGSEKVPDAKTMGRWGTAGPTVIQQIQERIVQIARAQRVVKGRKMRVDTTLVESNIHYPTDSTSLGDGVRVLIRTMKKVTKLTGGVGTNLRDRSRSVAQRVREIARAARSKAPPNQETIKQAYDKLLKATGHVVGQVKRFARDITSGVKRCTDVVEQVASEGQRQIHSEMVPRVLQVMCQTTECIFDGDSRSEGKIVSVFEPSAEVIRKARRASRPN